MLEGEGLEGERHEEEGLEGVELECEGLEGERLEGEGLEGEGGGGEGKGEDDVEAFDRDIVYETMIESKSFR